MRTSQIRTLWNLKCKYYPEDCYAFSTTPSCSLQTPQSSFLMLMMDSVEVALLVNPAEPYNYSNGAASQIRVLYFMSYM